MRTCLAAWHRLERSIPAILAGLGALFLVGMAMFLVWRSSDWVRGAPHMEIEPTLVDLGAVQNRTDNWFTITVTNTGSGLLHFEQRPYVQVFEDCCLPNLTVGAMTVEPGRSTTITSSIFSTSPSGDGRRNYAVQFVTDDPQQPDLVVNAVSNSME